MATDLGYETVLKSHVERERAAVKLSSKVGELLYDKGIELVLFRNHLTDITISEILNLNFAPAKIDIGKLASEWLVEKDNHSSKANFLLGKLENIGSSASDSLEPRDVVLYGFGRIGRLAARELIKQAGKGQQLRLRAIVTRGNSDAGSSKELLY